MFGTGNPFSRSRILPALLLCLGACASIPEEVRELPAGTALELDQTPFYPQERYQCGPAALLTVLTLSGADAALEDIVEKVYLPGKQGSLQLEMLAATRTEGRVPYVIDGTLGAIRNELEAGRPAIVLQNLGVAAIPRWHYAVVVGIDAQRDEVILRSGTDRRRITSVRTFLHTWRRGDYWAMIVLRPDELPAAVERDRYLSAIAALEQTGQLESAAQAWKTAEDRWPQDPVVLFGLGNVESALHNFATAEANYRALLKQDGSLLVARNNLALVLAEQGEFEEAMLEIGKALEENDDAGLETEFRDTEQTILVMRAAGQ
jgi:tetratricopeptide (TPR) repeat protein